MNPRNQVSDLIEFIQRATKLGKYNSSTGLGLVTAIRVAEKGLLEEEPKDLEYLLNHIEELFFRQKDINLSPQSQAVYFTRIRRAIDDYKKYGTDARAIYSWSPKVKLKKVSGQKSENLQKNSKSNNEDDTFVKSKYSNESEDLIIKEVGGIKLNVVTWRLRPGVMIKIELPEDLTKSDVERIKKLLDLEVEIFE